MSIVENLRNLSSALPEGVTVVAVSKRKPVEDILQAYEAGHRDFGENRVQELIEKQPRLPSDIRWHMVGHLQRNKVKYIAGFVDLIHSVDSLKLLQTINREGDKVGRIIPCLLQIHIAREETKFGLSREEALELAGSPELQSLENIRIDGLMGMATFTRDMDRVRSEFRYLAGVFRDLRESRFKSSGHFRQISMGMTGDYNIAIEEGSTIVRLGTIIFGPRTH
jgi:pyridoxal phosphate enzyme (YggS family)